jgi:hypothetical protein
LILWKYFQPAPIREGAKSKGGDPFKKMAKALKKPVDAAKKGAQRTINSAKKGVQKGINAAKKGAQQAINATKNAFAGILKGIMKLVNTITKPIVAFITKVDQFMKCMKDAFTAIGDYFKCIGEKIMNFPFCFIFYVLDVIYGIIKAIFFFIGIIFPFANDGIKMIFDGIEKIKKLINDFSKDAVGTAILYPDTIMKKCYICGGTPFPDFNKMSRCGKKPPRTPSRPIKYVSGAEVKRDSKNPNALSKDEILGLVGGLIFVFAGGLFMYATMGSFKHVGGGSAAAAVVVPKFDIGELGEGAAELAEEMKNDKYKMSMGSNIPGTMSYHPVLFDTASSAASAATAPDLGSFFDIGSLFG